MADHNDVNVQPMKESALLQRRISELESENQLLRQKAHLDRYAILDSIRDGYYEIDLDGIYTYVNQAICDYQGYAAEKLLGRNSRDFISPQCLPKVLDLYAQVYRTGVPGALSDYEFIHKDGGSRFIEISAALMRDEQDRPVGFRGIARDHTRERTRQLELERYRNLVESIEDGCFEVDLNGTMTFINHAMCRIHGYPYEELINMNHRDFATPAEAKLIFNVFNNIYRTGTPAKIVDYSIVRKDGTLKNLEVSASLIRDLQGRPVGFRGITRDRTEKKIEEQELERYRTFVEEVQEGCFEVDLNGNMTFCNAAGCRITGYPAEQLIGLNNRRYSSPESAEKTYHVFNQVYRTGKSADISGYEIKRSDGQLRYLDITVHLMRDRLGRPSGFRGICRDVTDRKATEAENERLVALLIQAQRLEAIATLAAGVAHNFNNLLMSIQGFVSLMLLDTEKSALNFNRLKTIEDLIKRGAHLTSQLLKYARHGRYAAKPTDTRVIIRSVLGRFQVEETLVQVSQKLSDSTWPVAADSEQLESVFMNLFVNAAEAMPKGGTLAVEVENVLLKEAFVKPHGQAAGPFVKITVADTGAGMDQATLQRIFEPFFSTKDFSRGAGLGLASVYGVIKSHGGIILVDSRKYVGTTFTIFLPAVPTESTPETDEPSPADVTRPTILLVDDEKIFRDAIRDILRKIGYDVITAQNGEEALALFRGNQQRINLVIVDMVIPGMSGVDVVNAMRTMAAELKVILISGFPEDGAVQNAMRDIRHVFLQKPLRPDSLKKTIRQLLEMS